ncbi:MAG: hypothetical protein ACI4XM_00575 [Candidatus Coprovivens sp.]
MLTQMIMYYGHVKKKKKYIIFCFIFLTIITACSNSESKKEVEKKNDISKIIGIYVADGTQYCLPIGIDENGNHICQDSNPSPYIINIKSDSTFTLTLTDYSVYGTVEYNEEKNRVRFIADDNLGLTCELEKEELHCDLYAKIFIKK